MSVIFQLAGKAQPLGFPKLTEAFDALEPALANAPGLERARLLVSGATLQTQLVFQWKSFEEGLAFETKLQSELGRIFQPLMEQRATLITSMLDFSTASSRDGAGVPGQPVIVHFAGSASAANVAKAREVLRGTAIPLMERGPGFQGIEVLVNHQDGKIQFLAAFADFDPTFAWFRENATALLTAFDGVVTRPGMPSFFAVAAEFTPKVPASVH